MRDNPSYEVQVHREGEYWAIDVPGVGHTQALDRAEVEATARDMIAAATEVDERSFALNVVSD